MKRSIMSVRFMMVLAVAMLLAMPLLSFGQHEPSTVQAGENAAAQTAARAEGEAGWHEEGQPSLVKAPNEALITAITTVIVFALLVVLLGKSAWGPIIKGLESRENKIRKDIEEAERARQAAEATLRDYNAKLAQVQSEVQATLAQASQQAERLAANIKAQAQKEAEDTKNRAVKDIEAARDQAVADVHAHAADLATTVASKILRRNLNPQDQQDLVNESLQQLQSVGTRA